MSPDGDEADRLDGAPHPRRAQVLIGHADHERDLLRTYREDRLPHAILLGGSAGIGKATLAWRLARFLVANPSGRVPAGAVDLAVDPAGKAAAEVASLSHPDIALLRREVNERTGRFFAEIRADDVRRTIGLFQRQPGAGGYRICIVDSAEDLNRSSANALLKLIEEPPPRSLFLIVAHRPGLVLPTIRSRARLLRLADLTPDEIGRVVRALGPPSAGLPDEVVAAAAGRARGSVREALRRLGEGGGDLDRRLAALLDRLPALDWRELHALADGLGGRNGDAVLGAILDAVRDWLAGQVRPDSATGAASPGRLAALAGAWERIGVLAREAQALNLDRRSLVFAIFTDLAGAARISA